jgi:hypothetical protein
MDVSSVLLMTPHVVEASTQPAARTTGNAQCLLVATGCTR